MKKLKYFLFPLCLVLIGCQSQRQRSYEAYQNQLNEIESAKLRGDLTPAEYLKLKLDVQNAFEERTAIEEAAILGSD